MLLKPEIQELLSGVGLSRNTQRSTDKDLSVSEKLELHGLGVEDSFSILQDIVNTSENLSLRHKIVVDVLKMHGLMKDTITPMPSFNIIINDNSGSGTSINPILIPREEVA
jgi:hypothetical protein